LTVAGTLIGTPAYMSPEQCSGARAGPQSDQYSLAVVAFQMLAGATPFQSDTLAGIIQHHFFTAPPDLRFARQDIPPALLDVIGRALGKNPTERFGSTNDMLHALEAIPFTAIEHTTSRRILRDLARGNSAPRINTGTFPALPDMPTLAVPPARAPAARATRAGRVMRSLAYVAAAVLVVGAGWAVTRLTSAAAERDASPEPHNVAVTPAVSMAPAPTAHTPPPLPAPVLTGKLRVLTSPPSAEILVDGRRVGIGGVVDLRIPTGARRLRVQAAGYQAWDTTIIVQTGATHTLGRVTLRAPSE